MWKSIQALRGVAALMVVLFHVIGEYGLIASKDSSTNQFQAGVDVFFVISGFVMVVATRDRDVTRPAFVRARLLRIVPLYWLALAVQLAILATTAPGAPPLGDIVQAYLFIPYRNMAAHDITPFLTLGWTLSYELYFYALFALTLGMRPWRQLGTLAAIFVAAVLLRKVVGDSSPIAFRLTSPLPFEFLAGVALAHILRGRTLPAALGLGLMAGAVALWLSPLHLLPRTIGFGVPALCLVAGAVMLEPWFRRPIAWPLETLGDASYSLYLTHGFAILVVLALLPHVSWAIGGSIMIVASVALALLVHRMVERPVLALVKRRRAISS